MTSMIDMDVGQKKVVVGSLEIVPQELADRMRNGGKRPGIDRMGKAPFHSEVEVCPGFL
jgi:hypothetical protein